ncbi:unnamed protein product [Sphagnum balticum]
MMNGKYGGTQLFNPMCTGNASIGDQQLRLQSDENARGGAAAIDGHFAYFGSGDRDASLRVYNTLTGTTRSAAPMTQWRRYYGMTIVDHDVLVCGGWRSNSELLPYCELYTPHNNIWNTYAPLPVATAGHVMLTLSQCPDSGRPFVFGGSNGDREVVDTVYTCINNTDWRERAPMPQALATHAGAQLDQYIAMVCGGRNEHDKVESACYLYNATEDVWTVMPSMHKERRAHGMTVYKGRVYVYGGYSRHADDDTAMLSSVEWRRLLDVIGEWHVHSERLHTADAFFASVPLPFEHQNLPTENKRDRIAELKRLKCEQGVRLFAHYSHEYRSLRKCKSECDLTQNAVHSRTPAKLYKSVTCTIIHPLVSVRKRRRVSVLAY